MPGAIIGAALATAAAAGGVAAVSGIAAVTSTLLAATFLTSLVLGAASSLLAPKPKSPTLPDIPNAALGNATQSVRQPITTGKLHFGRLRVGGAQTFLRTTHSNRRLHMVLTFGSNGSAGLDEIWFDDVRLVMSGNEVPAGEKYGSKVKFWFGDGTEAGDADLHEALADETDGVGAAIWTPAHRQAGFVKLYLRIQDWSVPLHFPRGIPNVTIVHRADPDIADPRDASTGWTNNAALVTARYLSISEDLGGYGDAAEDVDDDDLIAAANACDEIVALRAKSATFVATAADDSIELPDGQLALATGARLRVSSAGTLPGGLTAGTDYFFILTSENRGQLAATAEDADAGTAIAISDAGSGTHTLRLVTQFTADAALDRIELADASARLRTGTQVRVSSDGTLPAGLAADTDYYFAETGTLKGGLATSLANARKRVLIAIGDDGTGDHYIEATGEPRYTIDGVVDSADSPDKLLGDLAAAMAGWIGPQADFKWHIRAGVWTAPVRAALTADDFAGPVSVAWRREPRELFNAIKGTHVDPDANFQATDFPAVAPAIWLDEDQDVRAWKDIDLPFTHSPSMAQRIARVALERHRRQIAAKFVCKLTALDIAAGDVVPIDFARYGWADKNFEIANTALRVEPDPDPVLIVELEAGEIDEDVFAWTPADDQADRAPAARTTIADPSIVAAPTGLTLASGTAELDTRIDGTIFSRLAASWTAPDDGFVESAGRIELQIKKSAESDWAPSVYARGDETAYRFLDVADGVSYDVRIRSVNSLGVVSSWVTQTNHVVIGKTAAPADVTGFSASQNGTRVNFRADQHPDKDLERIEIRRAVLGIVDFDAATRTANLLRGEALVSEVVPPGDWTFLAAAFDTSGNRSAGVARFDLTIRNPNTVVRQALSAPDWLGTRTGLVLHPTGVLIPDSTMLAADMTDAALWDEFVHSPVATCRYEAPELDLGFDVGVAQPVRCYAAISAVLGPGETGAPVAALELDTRADAGGYDGFEPWSAGAVQGRYVKARVTLDPSAGAAYLAGFDPTVDAERRSEIVQGVAVAAGGSAVTFAQRFFNPPVVTVQPTGTTARIGQPSAVTATGCTAHVFDAAGAGVAATADITADGV